MSEICGTARLDSVWKLSDDYQEIFLNNTSGIYTVYEPVFLSSRTIHKQLHDDIFILEPHKFYKLEFILFNKDIEKCEDIENAKLKLSERFISTGLIIAEHNISMEKRALSVYNAGENLVMIQKGFILGEWYYGNDL